MNIYNQLSWRIIANNKIVDAKEGSWIADKYYSESIRNVIGKAIADWIAERNEFESKKAEDVITFAVDAKTYTAANWNAVVLWNLIHVYNCKYKTNGKCDIEAAFNEVEARIKQKYAEIEKIDTKIQDAIRDIKEYAKELKLDVWLGKFCKIATERIKEVDKRLPYEGVIAPFITLQKRELASTSQINEQYKYKSVWVTNRDVSGESAINIRAKGVIWRLRFEIEHIKDRLDYITIEFPSFSLKKVHSEEHSNEFTIQNQPTETKQQLYKIIAKAMKVLYSCEEGEYDWLVYPDGKLACATKLRKIYWNRFSAIKKRCNPDA